MDDELAAPYSRVFAWVRLNSWGRLRLYCMTDAGLAAKQADCAKALDLHKGTVSKCFSVLTARGMLEVRDNRIFPTLAPELKPVPDPDNEDHYSEFVTKWWRSSNPDLSRQLDEAKALDDRANALRKQSREIRRTIAPLIRHDYETWKATGELPPQQLLPGSVAVTPAESVNVSRHVQDISPDISQGAELPTQQPVTQLSPVADASPAVFSPPKAPVSDDPPGELQTPRAPSFNGLDVEISGDGQTKKPSVRRPPVTPTLSPKDAHRTRIRNVLRDHRRPYRMNSDPDNLIIEEIAERLTDDAAFWRFVGELRKMRGRGRPESWKWFVAIAAAVAANPGEAEPENPDPIVKIPPQSEDEMLATLKAAGIADEELDFFRAKVAGDRARSA